MINLHEINFLYINVNITYTKDRSRNVKLLTKHKPVADTVLEHIGKVLAVQHIKYQLWLIAL